MSSDKPLKHQNTLYGAQFREFKHGIQVDPKQQLYHTSQSGVLKEVPISELMVEDVTPLLFSEVAIYDFVFGGSPEREALFQALWDVWFPHRDKTLTLEDPVVERPTKSQMRTLLQAGLAVLFRPASPRDGHAEWDREVSSSLTSGDEAHEEVAVSPRALQWLVDWHEALTGRVAHISTSQSTEETAPRDLQPSFQKMFILLDRSDWKTHGCLLCCREDVPSEFQHSNEKKDVVHGKHAWTTWRVGIPEAVQMVMDEALSSRT